MKSKNYILRTGPVVLTVLLAVAPGVPIEAADVTLGAESQAVITRHEVGAFGRELRKEVIVPAPRKAVFEMWTTPDAIPKFFFPKADIDLAIGGRYDLYDPNFEPDMHGLKGAQGCRILSYIPDEMLSFDWTFPPSIMTLRSVQAKTHVVLRFDELSPSQTRVRFAQLGWQEGDAWDQGYKYFDAAWTKVMTRLIEHFSKRPVEPAVLKAESEGVRTWTNGPVIVRAAEKPIKFQEFEMTVSVPVEKVWKTLATSEGLMSIGGKDSRVDLQPSGIYAYWPDSPNRVLSYVPNEMLSTSGSAPPQFPNVRKGGTWSAYFFEAVDANTTRIRLPVYGWRPGEEEWDQAYDYFLKNTPIFLKRVYDGLAAAD
jgi:uncharacterized protein YndB with AHSA1/START domain